MTNRELAKLVGLSPASFSLIINNKPGISEQTRERVLLKLAELGYSDRVKPATSPAAVPTNSAASIKTLCFLIYIKHGKVLNQNPYFLLLTGVIEDRARQYGYEVITKTIDASYAIEPQIKSVCNLDPAGVIIFATEMQSDDLINLRTLSCPFVALDNEFTSIPVNSVAIDNILGAYQAIEYLHSMGHTEIGYLRCGDIISSFNERTEGYRRAMGLFALNAASEYEYILPFTEHECYQALCGILETHPILPTAFVCDDDTLAAGAIRAFKEYGYRVPEDISIIGFNDRPLCENTLPPLTSVNVPRSSFGSEAVDMLVNEIRREAADVVHSRSLKLRVGTQLKIRASVADKRAE